MLLVSLLVLSCEDPKYKNIGQEIIDGKVSATQEGHSGRGVSRSPTLWIQTDKITKEVNIPFEFENRWKVGDSCLLIIQKYEIIKEE